ncbi:MAG TPA: cupin domain-containing protein [Baekduia sp.]|nr:cupin domain-containing protein [Baekduia sp.]
MAYAGQRLEHPVTKERFTFVRTAADTGGALLEIDAVCAPGATPAAPHIHPLQDETFTLHAGRVRLELADEVRELVPGETLTVPMGVAHTWSAVGDEDAHMTVRFDPALSTEAFFEEFFGLAQAGKVNAKGMPSLLRVMVLLDDHRGTLYLASAPVAVQRVLARLLAPIGRLLGYGNEAGRASAATGDVEIATPAPSP